MVPRITSAIRIIFQFALSGPRWAWLQANEWAWFTGLFAVSVGVSSVNEFGLAGILLIAAAVACASQLFNWQPRVFEPLLRRIVKGGRFTAVIIILICALGVLNVYRSDRPWSQLPQAMANFFSLIHKRPVIADIPFDPTRSESLGNFIVIPDAENEPFTTVKMQLLPPTQEIYPDKKIINAILLTFNNQSESEDKNVSVKLYLPGIRNFSCEKPLAEAVEGGKGSTEINFLVRRLPSKEKFSCRVYLDPIVADISTITEWKKRYGSLAAWSQNRGQFEVLIYQIEFGVEQDAPPGSIRPKMQKLTINVK